MSLQLLEENWSIIKSKVVEPLWRGEFKLMYESVKMDKKDFYSLAGYALTKAFATYDPEKSNILTFSTDVLKRKAYTELRDRRRKKRAADAYAESIYKPIGETDETIEDIIESSRDIEEDKENSARDAIEEIKKTLSFKEKKIIELSFLGFNNKTISKVLKLDMKDVAKIKKRISEKSTTPRALRMNGFLGGDEDEN